MVSFNRRRRTENTSGPGRIRKTDAEEGTDVASENEVLDTGGTGWVKPVAIGGGILAAAGLAVMLVFSGGGDGEIAEVEIAPPVVTVDPDPVIEPPVIVDTEPALPGASSILASSIAAKNDVIYVDRANEMAEAYITSSGQEGRNGQDFATHVGMYELGGVSVLITEGPYAGARIGFFPEDTRSGGELRVVFEQVGRNMEVETSSGITTQFVVLPAAEVERYEVVLSGEAEMGDWNGGVTRNHVSLSANAHEFEKQIQEPSGWYPAFWLHGSPHLDGKFMVELWNGDSYSIDLGSGDFSVSSGYLFNPDVDQEINVAFNEAASDGSHADHNLYVELRENGLDKASGEKGCEWQNTASQAWENCGIYTPGYHYPAFVNGTIPTLR